MLLKKYISLFILLLILLPIFNNSVGLSNIGLADITSLSFKQEIEIPFDTAMEQAKYQPIDIRVEFSEPCYAKNEIEHSVMVGCDTGSEVLELESQIYDLEHTDDDHICACSVVFLIPPEACGNEKYYVFYDSGETKSITYKDHVKLSETHYFYEPISGQKIDFDCYEITDGEELVYAVIQKGELLGNPVGHNIAKLKPGSTFVETYNMDQLGSFDFIYGVLEDPGYYGPSFAETVSKQVLVDGNLMVRVRINSTTPKGDILTDNIYTYYHQPTIDKKIIINSHHEVLEDIDIKNPELYNGAFAGIVSVKARSATIEKLNTGEILPELSVYTEQDTIKKYDVPTNPDSSEVESVLTTDADIDIGEKAWVSLSNPSTDITHAIILESNKSLSNGVENGLQVKAWVTQNIKLPGLEADTGNVYIMRNAFEKNKEHDTKLKKGFTIDGCIEFISFESDAEEKIDDESEIFQSLVKIIPYEIKEEIGDAETKRYQLETFVHIAPSFPLGSLLSAALGKNISYIYAELYKEDSFKSSGAVSRISLAGMDIDLDEKSLLEKVKTVITLFDWKNVSIFKKIIFPNIEPGTYIIKIFKENPLFEKDRQFIGFSVVNVEDDTINHIYCTIQGNIDINVFDQYEKPVEGVVFSLEYNGNKISGEVSSENGTCLISVPCKPAEEYALKAFYNGFLIYEQPVKLKLMNHVKSYNISLSLEYYDLLLKVKDTWGFAPAVDVQPVLTSDEMIIPTVITSEEIDDGKYIFTGITPGDYTISMNYKSFEKIQEINIEKNTEIGLVFPAEYTVEFNTYDSYAQGLSNGEIIVKRNGKQEKININEEGKSDIAVPPGSYEITVLSDDEETGKINLQVRSDKTVDLITKKDSFLHTFVLVCSLILIVFSLYIVFVKKQRYNGLKLFVISLVLISIFSPWWSLNGDNGTVETSTNILVFPQKIVTLTSSSDAIGGEISQVPEEATMALEILFILLLSAILLNLISIFTKKRFRKTTKIISILNFVILLFTILLFYIVISQLTEIGVGSVMGSGDLDVNIPCEIESTSIYCSWGPGIGFYLTVLVLIFLIFTQIFKRQILGLLKRKNL